MKSNRLTKKPFESTSISRFFSRQFQFEFLFYFFYFSQKNFLYYFLSRKRILQLHQYGFPNLITSTWQTLWPPCQRPQGLITTCPIRSSHSSDSYVHSSHYPFLWNAQIQIQTLQDALQVKFHFFFWSNWSLIFALKVWILTVSIWQFFFVKLKFDFCFEF